MIYSRALLISFTGHLAVFSIFSFSLGPRIPKANFSDVFFWGPVLNNSDLAPGRNSYEVAAPLRRGGLNLPCVGVADTSIKIEISPYLKPQTALAFNEDKPVFTKKQSLPFAPKIKTPVIMFYPALPHQLSLYFSGRQAVHIELLFNIISSGRANSVAVKRKISSGNLEADLLSMRYISRYLSTQQAGFPHNQWQAVKIDLGVKQ